MVALGRLTAVGMGGALEVGYTVEVKLAGRGSSWEVGGPCSTCLKRSDGEGQVGEDLLPRAVLRVQLKVSLSYALPASVRKCRDLSQVVFTAWTLFAQPQIMEPTHSYRFQDLGKSRGGGRRKGHRKIGQTKTGRAQGPAAHPFPRTLSLARSPLPQETVATELPADWDEAQWYTEEPRRASRNIGTLSPAAAV